MNRTILFLTMLMMLSNINLFADTIPGGYVSGTWTATGSPYLIQGDITIHADSTLTIEPGVEVNFQGHYKLAVEGALEALGTAQDSIVFTAVDAVSGWQGIRINGDADPARLDYCIIEHGFTTGSAFSERGGGIYCGSADAVITHCRISDNRSFSGGGIFVYIGSGGGPFTISDCTFSNNEAENVGGGFGFRGPQLVLTRCLFEENKSDSIGGGIYCYGYIAAGSVVRITGCTFDKNRAEDRGGGMFFTNSTSGGISISDCLITSNIAFNHGGGGISFDGTAGYDTVANCTFSNNINVPFGAVSALDGGSGIDVNSGHLTISQCTFEQNYGANGGTVFCRGGTTIVKSCTFSQNSDWGGPTAGALRLDANATIINTIVSGNHSTSQGNPSAGINFESGTHSAQYCDFSGNDEGRDFIGPLIPNLIGEITGVNANGDSCDIFFNIFLNPMFVDTANGDLHLQASSPCIDAGDSTFSRDPDSTITDIGRYYFYQPPVAVELENKNPIPLEFGLHQNYPNPFNPTTNISFNLLHKSSVSLKVFDALGREVSILLYKELPAGTYSHQWNAGGLASGVYFYRLQAGSFIETKKLILLR